MKVGVSYHSLWLNESIINFMMSDFGKRGASKGIVFHKTSVLRKFGKNNDIGVEIWIIVGSLQGNTYLMTRITCLEQKGYMYFQSITVAPIGF